MAITTAINTTLYAAIFEIVDKFLFFKDTEYLTPKKVSSILQFAYLTITVQ